VSSEPSHEVAKEIHELHQEKDDQVLEREPMETELMDEDRSDAGKDVAGVEDDEAEGEPTGARES